MHVRILASAMTFRDKCAGKNSATELRAWKAPAATRATRHRCAASRMANKTPSVAGHRVGVAVTVPIGDTPRSLRCGADPPGVGVRPTCTAVIGHDRICLRLGVTPRWAEVPSPLTASASDRGERGCTALGGFVDSNVSGHGVATSSIPFVSSSDPKDPHRLWGWVFGLGSGTEGCCFASIGGVEGGSTPPGRKAVGDKITFFSDRADVKNVTSVVTV